MWNENWIKFHKNKQNEEMLSKDIVFKNACLQRSYLAASLLGTFGGTKLCHIGSTASEESKLLKHSPDLLPAFLLPRERNFLDQSTKKHVPPALFGAEAF